MDAIWATRGRGEDRDRGRDEDCERRARAREMGENEGMWWRLTMERAALANRRHAAR